MCGASQKLVEAKLKRMFAEGAAERAAARAPAAEPRAVAAAEPAAADGASASASADAHMAALLEEVELEGECAGGLASAAARQKKKKKRRERRPADDEQAGGGGAEGGGRGSGVAGADAGANVDMEQGAAGRSEPAAHATPSAPAKTPRPGSAGSANGSTFVATAPAEAPAAWPAESARARPAGSGPGSEAGGTLGASGAIGGAGSSIANGGAELSRSSSHASSSVRADGGAPHPLSQRAPSLLIVLGIGLALPDLLMTFLPSKRSSGHGNLPGEASLPLGTIGRCVKGAPHGQPEQWVRAQHIFALPGAPEAAAETAAKADAAQPAQAAARAALDAAIAQALHMLDLAGGARGSQVPSVARDVTALNHEP